MLPLLLAFVAFVGIKAMKGATPGSAESAGSDGIVRDGNKWGLPDIDQANQHGTFIRDFDESFERASGQTGVPFALIKAHAIRESSLKQNAYHYDNASSGASYGLMQVEWNNNNRFVKYGVTDDQIGSDGGGLYDPDLNTYLGACIIRDNLDWLKGSLRDAINAYNTGVPESKRAAPANYVDDVINYYQSIIGGSV